VSWALPALLTGRCCWGAQLHKYAARSKIPFALLQWAGSGRGRFPGVGNSGGSGYFHHGACSNALLSPICCAVITAAIKYINGVIPAHPAYAGVNSGNPETSRHTGAGRYPESFETLNRTDLDYSLVY